MESNLKNLKHHSFEKVSDNQYLFKNSYGIEYEVYFSDGSGYFPDNNFSSQLFVFGFTPTHKILSSFDDLTSNTIIKILLERLVDNLHIILYVCDARDKKQAIRNRLFNQWFHQYNDGSLDKFDIVFESDIFVSAIISKNHINYSEFLFEFPYLGQEYK
jgi:hypothetical protein